MFELRSILYQSPLSRIVPRQYLLSMKESRGGADLFPKEKFLIQAAYEGIEKEVAARVLDTASTALRTWEHTSTDFLTPPEYTGLIKLLGGLVDLQCIAWGGYPEAERKRLLFCRSGLDTDDFTKNGVAAIEIGGQFLFDMAEHRDYLGSILGTGIDRKKIGDILVQGERGAQVLCDPNISDYICSNLTSVRSVTTKVTQIPLTELKVTASSRKQITSTEASLRLDAICSAGIGMSRNKIVDAIKSGLVLVNWREAKGSSVEMKAGDVITVRGKGRVEVVEIKQTKNGRFRVVLNRIS